MIPATQSCAYTTVYYAVKTGRLPPVKSLKCKDCGNPAKNYDHIAGYEGANKLVVEPVCLKCHARREQIRGTRGRFKASRVRICFLCFRPFKLKPTSGNNPVFCGQRCAQIYKMNYQRDFQRKGYHERTGNYRQRFEKEVSIGRERSNTYPVGT